VPLQAQVLLRAAIAKRTLSEMSQLRGGESESDDGGCACVPTAGIPVLVADGVPVPVVAQGERAEQTGTHQDIPLPELCDGKGMIPHLGVLRAASTMALAKLVLTDFGVLTTPKPEQLEATWGQLLPLHPSESAHDRLLSNLKRLQQHGAVTDDGMPFNRVSGFPKSKDEDSAIRNPAELFSNKDLKLLFWGSPHPRLSAYDMLLKCHGSKAIAETYKTQAFESMAWLCPTGVVAMTFSVKYRVEFYQPCNDPTARNRALICAKMYSRSYVPMSSSPGLRFAVPGNAANDVMLAVLMPPSLLDCLCWKEEQIDFGITILNILRVMGENEYGCALGIYDGSLEMELVEASSF
jgi:hypothetical protein